LSFSTGLAIGVVSLVSGRSISGRWAVDASKRDASRTILAPGDGGEGSAEGSVDDDRGGSVVEDEVATPDPAGEAPPVATEGAEAEVAAPESGRARVARYARSTKARADVLRAQAAAGMERIEADRDRRPSIDVILSVRDEDARLAGRELAAAVAYRLFFLFLPLILVLVAGLGIARSTDKAAVGDAVKSSGASVAVAQSISGATGELSFFQHVLVLGIGISGTFFAGRGLVRTLVRVNAEAWDIPIPKLQRPMKVVGIILGLLMVLVVLGNAWNSLRGKLGVLEFLVALPVVGLAYAAVVVLLHDRLPRPDGTHWGRLVPGAVFIGIAIASLQAFVLGYIAHKLSSSSALYGGLGTAIVLLFWLYLIGRVFVLGPILDAVLWRRKVPDAAEPD
jgi:uncharacterized BrkB/YihY/UPF0761 family membrane protein